MIDKHLSDGKSRQISNNGLTVCALASGSRGNAIYVSDGATALLVDAGLSGIEIQRRLNSKGLCADDLDAILVTHEHDDHIRGVGVLSRRFDLPVYISRTTETAAPQLGKLHRTINFDCGTTFNINNFIIHPFSISHDAMDPAGFTIKQNGSKVGIATDLGVATAMVKAHLKECSLLILEANHDPEMLAQGSYPWPLKQRIKGRTGHLSNVESKTLLAEIKHDRLKHVVLAHLSDENNTPETALSEVGSAIDLSETALYVATQNKCLEPIRL